MEIKTEPHSGKCGHCITAVPQEAVVCTGCGSRWGLKDGDSRQQHYDKAKEAHKFTRVILIIALLTALYTCLNFGFTSGFITVMLGGIGLFSWLVTSGLIDESKKGKVTWWR